MDYTTFTTVMDNNDCGKVMEINLYSKYTYSQIYIFTI